MLDVSAAWRRSSAEISVTFGGVVGAAGLGAGCADGLGPWAGNAIAAAPSDHSPTARAMMMPSMVAFKRAILM